jgi:hypothetical protein
MPPKRANIETPPSSKKKKVDTPPPPTTPIVRPEDEVLIYKYIQTTADYFPQLNDVVIFFKKGYNAYVDLLKQDKLDKYMKIPTIEENAFECTITNIEFVYYLYKESKPHAPGTFARLTLTGGTQSYIVDYNLTIPGIIPFLILKDAIYLLAKEKYESLHLGDIASVPFGSEILKGEIVKIDDKDMFESISVGWEDGDPTQISPWELTDCKTNFDYCFDEATHNYLTKKLKFKITDLPAITTAYPIYLFTIQKRLECKFYRSKESFLLDLNHIIKSLEGSTAKDYPLLCTMRNNIVDYLYPKKKNLHIETAKVDPIITSETTPVEEEDDEEDDDFGSSTKKKKSTTVKKKVTPGGKKAPVKKSTPAKKTPAKQVITPIPKIDPIVSIFTTPTVSQPSHDYDITSLISDFEGGNFEREELPDIAKIAEQMKFPKKKPNITVDIPVRQEVVVEETTTPTSSGKNIIKITLPVPKSNLKSGGKGKSKYVAKSLPPKPTTEILDFEEPTPVVLNFEAVKPVTMAPPRVLESAPIKAILPVAKMLVDSEMDEMEMVSTDPIEDFVPFRLDYKVDNRVDNFLMSEVKEETNILEDTVFIPRFEAEQQDWARKVSRWKENTPIHSDSQTNPSMEVKSIPSTLNLNIWVPHDTNKIEKMKCIQNVYYLTDSNRITSKLYEFPLNLMTYYFKTDSNARKLNLTIQSNLKPYHLEEIERITTQISLFSRAKSLQQISKYSKPDVYTEVMNQYGFLADFERSSGLFVKQTKKCEFTILELCSIEDTFQLFFENKKI